MPDWMLDLSLFGMPFHFWTAVFFVLGAIIGSFLNVCIHRMPRGESVFRPASHCPSCGGGIPLWHNIPVVSWFVLRGRCAQCGVSIAPRYVIVEILTGLVFAATWLEQGRHSVLVPWAWVALLAIFIASSAIDFQHFIIPDELTLGGMAAGVVLSVLIPGLHGVEAAFAGFKASLIGAAVGGGVVYAVLRMGKWLFGREHVVIPAGERVIFHEHGLLLPGREIEFGEVFYRKSDTIVMHGRRIEMADRCYGSAEVRLSPDQLMVGADAFKPEEVPYLEAECDWITLPREAMGLGDVKFMACIGAFLGWQAAVFSLCVSSFFGAVVGLVLILIRRREWSSRLPYGPYIALAATCWMFGGSVWWDRFFAGSPPP